MTRTFKNPVRCAALVVVFLLAAARCELTLAQDLAPDPYFSPIADKSTPLMPRVILRNIREDRDGNIWFASFGGPIRYDGKAFTNFAEEAGIAERRIFSLIVDKSARFGLARSPVALPSMMANRSRDSLRKRAFPATTSFGFSKTRRATYGLRRTKA